MIILKELLECAMDTTLLSLDLRDGDMGKLIKAYKIGECVNEETVSVHEWRRAQQGELVLIDSKINYHGMPDKTGGSIIGWGLVNNAIPKELLDCAVSHFFQTPNNRGHAIHAHIYRVQQSLIDGVTI